MSVWFAIASARPNGGTVSEWKAKGYRIALFRDIGAPDIAADIVISNVYEGYAKAVNALCKRILDEDPLAEWIVTGGDDNSPDPNHTPDEIASQCTEHFNGTFGVMQPTGDRWGESTATLVQYGKGRAA